jgi:uncharacterized protein with ATP-grasp and redox domains
MKEACQILGEEFSTDKCSAELATKVHRSVYELLGCVDPYNNIKELAMNVGLQLEDKAKKLINTSDPSERLRTAVLVSIVGNVLDFGIPGGVSNPDELLSNFDKIYNEGLGHDDIDQLIPYMRTGAQIVFFSDNCGEIVFDKLLCQVLKEFGVRITLVVKGESILSDATLAEAEHIGMDKVVDEIITTEVYAVGLSIINIPVELKKQLENCDLIISKGMANFEALSELEFGPVFHILRTKCEPVAAALGLPKDLNVAKLFK